MKKIIGLLLLGMLFFVATVNAQNIPVKDYLKDTNIFELRVRINLKAIWSTDYIINAVISDAQGGGQWIKDIDGILYTDGKVQKKPYNFPSRVILLNYFDKMGYEMIGFESSPTDQYGQGVVTYMFKRKLD
jgi:hypothetical protein